MPFGSILAGADNFELSTADNKTVKITGVLSRLALKLFGIPHIGMQVRARNLLRLLEPDDGVMLDAGCGIGVYALQLGYNTNKVYAVDIDKKKLDEGKKVCMQLNLGNYVYYKKANLVKLPFRNEMFSNVIMSDVLEHIEDDKKVLSEAARVLRLNGVLVLSVPTKLNFNKKYRERFGHFREYSLTSLKEILPKNMEIEYSKEANRWLGQVAWTLNRFFFFSKYLTILTWLPLYFLTFFDTFGRGRELIVKCRKVRL